MKFILSLSLKVKIIIAACAVAAAAVVGTVIVLNSEEAYRVVKVFELNGNAVVTRENTGDIDAYAGMNLESGDILSVEENSTLRISLDSDKYILLDGGTVLELIAQGTAADSKTAINLRQGTILNEIKNSLSANSSYEVNTPKATMAVRGTVFRVTTRQNPDGSYVTDLYTSEGVVSVQLLDENGAPKGKEVYVPKGGAVTIITEVNDKTGNPAATDGNSHFVLRTDDGGYAECGEEDAVYYPDDKASAEVQTEQTVTSVPTDTETEKTTSSVSESESAVTTVPDYEAVMRVSEIPTVTTVPTETGEPIPVIPSEISSAVPYEASETTATTVPETTATADSKTQRSTQTTVTYDEKTTAAFSSTTSAAETRLPSRKYPPLITNSAANTAPTTTVTTAPTSAATTVPTSVITTVPTSVVTTVPTETATITPTETIPTVPTETEPTSPTETEPTVPTETTTESSSVSSETSSTESSETETETETSPTPTVHRVSFIGADGSIISESEFNENETLGTLPQIADKRGYTGKWVSGGAEVTENTVISEDMNIRLEYTPMPVTVLIEGPVGTPDGSGTETILTFTIPYDGNLTDSGYTIESISQAAYNHYSGTVSYDYSIRSINVLYPDYAEASDSTIITGDAVVDDSGGLVCYIVCNFDVILITN